MNSTPEYTEISLRDFRHSLGSLKNTLKYGKLYKITERGKSLAYFVPAHLSLTFSQNDSAREDALGNRVTDLIGTGKASTEVLEAEGDYKKTYRALLGKKYLK